MKLIMILCLAAGGAALAQPSGTFTAAATGWTGGSGSTATLLEDGRVLVVAGPNAGLYDPKTGTFSATAGSRTYSSTFQSATLLPDGRVLFAGGLLDLTYPTSQFEIFDPSTGAFTLPEHYGSMVFAKTCPSAVLLNNGKVLIAGGSQFLEPFGEASAEVYDPVSQTFTVAGPYASFPSPILDPMHSGDGWCPTALMRRDGKVAILWMGDGVGAASEVFDPATNTFAALQTPLFQGLPQVSDVPLASGLALFAGADSSVTPPSTYAGLYDPNSGLVSLTGPLIELTTDTSGVLLPDGTVLIAGNGGEIFDPARGAFTEIGNVFWGGGTAAVLLDGTVLLGDVAGYSIYHPNKLIPAPTLFALSGSGNAQGAIWNSSTGQVASAQNPVGAGDVLSMYTTSLIEGGVIPPQVSVGGLPANVLFFGDAPGYPGYFQVNFQVPEGIAAGSGVPVRLTYVGRSSNPVLIAVH